MRAAHNSVQTGQADDQGIINIKISAVELGNCVPNEVPILVDIPFISLLAVTVAVCGGVLRQFKDVISDPVAHFIWHRRERDSAECHR